MFGGQVIRFIKRLIKSIKRTNYFGYSILVKVHVTNVISENMKNMAEFC